jgi:alanine racemase
VQACCQICWHTGKPISTIDVSHLRVLAWVKPFREMTTPENDTLYINLISMSTQHHVTVNVSLDRFASNIRFMQQMVAPANLCVVMKADAYGHGLNELVPVAASSGADYIGICTNPEAHIVRKHLPDIPMLRLRSALPEEYEESVKSLHIDEQVGCLSVGEYLNDLGRRYGIQVPVHLKIDTGMGRSGFFPNQMDEIRGICSMPGLKVVGLMTHLANADAGDLAQTQVQLDEFWRLRDALDDVLPCDIIEHTHNSAATIRLPERRARLVRVGAACYGVRTSSEFDNPPELQPVMSVRTRVMEIRNVPAGTTVGYGSLFRTARPSRIATVPVGFGEGYPRALYNKGIVLINGQRCPVIGRISLNVTTIDVTDLDPAPRLGDEVVMIGSQGKEKITFEELADKFASVHTELNLMAGHMNQRSYQN